MKRSQKSKHLLVFALLNLGIAAVGLLFLLYARFALSDLYTGVCVFKVLTRLYCPACGGTRAVSALWHFDILTALKSNAYVVFFALFTVYYEIRTFVRILKDDPHPYWIPGWAGWGLLILWGVFFAARNVLLLAGIDFLGDYYPPPF